MRGILKVTATVLRKSNSWLNWNPVVSKRQIAFTGNSQNVFENKPKWGTPENCRSRKIIHGLDPIMHSTVTAKYSQSSKAEPEANLSDLLHVEMVETNIKKITLNRPRKKNAMTQALFRALADAVTAGSNDPATNIIVWTGHGDYFCAGIDIKEGFGFDAKDPALKYLTKAFIDCKKPVVVVVNGSAVGIGVTLLGLCDAIFSVDSATFWTPFSQLGICAEACSSYTFPRMMGYAQANEMLMFGTKMNAKQAETCGLVTQIFPHAQFEAEAWTRIKAMAKLPIKSLQFTKELVRGRERELLHEVNENEVLKISELTELLRKRLQESK